MKIFYLFICMITGSLFQLSGQQVYDIKDPGHKFEERCSKFYDLIRARPKEVLMGLRRDEFDNILFEISSKAWFDKIFANHSDGISVDIVAKDMYDCNTGSSHKTIGLYRGKVLKPIYLEEMLRNMTIDSLNTVIINIGKLPKNFTDKEIEFNLLILKNKYLCYYSSFYNIKRYKWELLDMGMYLDTLTKKFQKAQLQDSLSNFTFRSKQLTFTIPFEQNKSDYSIEDIKPLYDSLHLTDYQIGAISIRAFASVEGSKAGNYALQKARAESIIKALQSYQKPTITTTITTSENWVEFLEDISTTKFKYLALLSKAEIRDKLKDEGLVKELEVYLKDHRKAIVILDLRKKDLFSTIESPDLILRFNKSVRKNDLKEATRIQNALFERIKHYELPVSFIDNLEIPKQSVFGVLLSNKATFKYVMNDVSASELLYELKELEKLLPKEGHIKYNICVLQFSIWLENVRQFDFETFKIDILQLETYKIPLPLINRMMVNYHIILTEYYMLLGEYEKKDEAIRFIHTNYSKADLTPIDLLNLAQYFVVYAQYDWAIKLLAPHVKDIKIDEDLLFYYLNLTIIDNKLTKAPSYRLVMLNALDLNKKRFCKLFDPIEKEGITFQLLENKFLMKTFCENCN